MTPRPTEDSRVSPEPVRRPRRQQRRREREDQVTRYLPSGSATTEDRVTRTHIVEEGEAALPRHASPRAQPFVLPAWRQLATLAAPHVVAAASTAGAIAVTAIMGAFTAVFVVPLVVPSLILAAMDRSRIGQGWPAVVSVNLATMLLLVPTLVIRQRAVHVPYLTTEHGTMFAASVATIMVVVTMVAIAFVAAWASRQDPESSPMLFLPAAMLVPLMTSATEFAQLDVALSAAGMIFALTALLTLISSLMPPIYTVFVGPLTVAVEVLFVSLIRQDRIFPVGVAPAGITLFGIVILAAIGLTVLLPAVSSWMQRVELLRSRQFQRG